MYSCFEATIVTKSTFCALVEQRKFKNKEILFFGKMSGHQPREPFIPEANTTYIDRHGVEYPMGQDIHALIAKARAGDLRSQAMLTKIREITVRVVVEEAQKLDIPVDDILARIPDPYWAEDVATE